MGTQLPIKKYINEVNRKKKFKLDEKTEQELKEIIMQIQSNFNQDQEQMIISKNNLRNLLQISEKKNFEKIFNIFGEKNENKQDIVTFESLEYLYYAFHSDNPKIKFILFSFMIFENNETIEEKEINNIIKNLLIRIEKIYLSFANYPMSLPKIMNYKNKKQNKNEDFKMVVTRNDFIRNMNNINGGLELLEKYKFINDFKPMSEFKFDDKNNQNKLNFYCDCGQIRIKEKNKGYISDDFDSVKREFEDITSKTNKVLTKKNFEKMMRNQNIDKNLIKLITDYLEKITLKDYCCFEDLKYLFSNLKFTTSLDDKKKFLFKLISFVNKNEPKLPYNEIAKYLKIEKKDENKNEIKEEKEENIIILNKEDKENNNDNNELYDEAAFIKDEKFDEMIKDMNPSLEKFGLLPYLEFRLKTDDKKIRKRLINDILKNNNIESHEKYLESQFEDCDSFYAIDMKFWNVLMDPNKDAPEYINNSKIAEEIKIEKFEDKYRKIEEERVKKVLEETKKKREENEKKKKSGFFSNFSSKKNEENNKKEKKDEKEKEKEKEKVENKEENKKIEIKTKNARLKKGVKYNQDFIIICGPLFNQLRNNYQIDYIIKMKKFQELIDLSEKPTKEEKKEDEKPKEKEKEDDNEKKNNQEQKEIDEKKEKEKKEDEEDYIKKEKLVKETLDKFIIDSEKGFIKKIVKFDSNSKNKEDQNKYVLYEIDFYPVQVYTKTFGVLVREVEKAKIKYEE